MKSWLNQFLSSCMRQLKLPKIWKRALVVAIPKPMKPPGDPKSYRPISLLCIPFKIPERLIYVRVEPIIDPLPPMSKLVFGTEDQPLTKSLYSLKKLRTASWLKRRLALCSLISQQPMSPCGTAVSPASFCVCSRTGTWCL